MSINPWKQASPVTWERSTTGYERFFFRLALKCRDQGQPEDYFIRSQIRIAPVPTIEQVKAAWMIIRSLQPGLATDWKQVGSEFVKTYRAGNEEEWADKTLVVVDDIERQSIPPQSIPKLFFSPASGELLLRTPHWATDARGTLFFWNTFLRELSLPTSSVGQETTRLPASVGDGLGCISTDNLTEKQKAQTMGGLMDYASGGVSAVHPPTTVGIDTPGRSTFQDAALTAEQTALLVEGCKKRGYSVTSAVHAAVVLANIEVSENKEGAAVSHGVSVFDLRKYLVPGEADKYPFNLYAVPYPYALPLATPTTSTRFEDVAQYFGKYYKDTFKSEEERLLVNHWLDVLDGAIASPEAAKAPPQKDPHTSSIGIIDDYIQREYGEYRVEDFHFVAEATGTSSCIFWYTFRGTLRLAYAYNEALYRKEDIRRMLDSVTGILAKEFPCVM